MKPRENELERELDRERQRELDTVDREWEKERVRYNTQRERARETQLFIMACLCAPLQSCAAVSPMGVQQPREPRPRIALNLHRHTNHANHAYNALHLFCKWSLWTEVSELTLATTQNRSLRTNTKARNRTDSKSGDQFVQVGFRNTTGAN